MTNREFKITLQECLMKIKESLDIKGNEYASGTDRLSNFKKAARFRSTTPEDALMGFVIKHIIALQDFIEREKQLPGRVGNISNEQWDEKIFDICNYMLLLKCLRNDLNKRKQVENG